MFYVEETFIDRAVLEDSIASIESMQLKIDRCYNQASQLQIVRDVLKDVGECTDTWLAACNENNVLFRMINIDQPLFNRLSDRAKYEVCMEHLGDTILSWLRKAWEWIVKKYNALLNFLKAVLNKKELTFAEAVKRAGYKYATGAAETASSFTIFNVYGWKDLHDRFTILQELLTTISSIDLKTATQESINTTFNVVFSKYANIGTKGIVITDEKLVIPPLERMDRVITTDPSTGGFGSFDSFNIDARIAACDKIMYSFQTAGLHTIMTDAKMKYEKFKSHYENADFVKATSGSSANEPDTVAAWERLYKMTSWLNSTVIEITNALATCKDGYRDWKFKITEELKKHRNH